MCFNAMFVIACSILFGMTSSVGLELKYRQNRRIDASVETLRGMFEEHIEAQDFTTPLYYFAVSNPFTKAATAILVVSLTLLSSAGHVRSKEYFC
ncbi:hypothetical protein ANCCAN_20136 [Ancylostoma caninum]|uniref:Uncharacterized protein n=1 Tax=Ancylostoma caninum TaxID=29170 RepID=A0A368FTA4_ANCCA|nr:hypothetical protein ANCCAN_20136 [Ancylostoma caninum]